MELRSRTSLPFPSIHLTSFPRAFSAHHWSAMRPHVRALAAVWRRILPGKEPKFLMWSERLHFYRFLALTNNGREFLFEQEFPPRKSADIRDSSRLALLISHHDCAQRLDIFVAFACYIPRLPISYLSRLAPIVLRWYKRHLGHCRLPLLAPDHNLHFCARLVHSILDIPHRDVLL